MAKVHPDFETISKLRVKPTEGELTLLKYLNDNLDESYELFFNPYLDGDRPDIIILKESHGAVIIEVKDWDLACNAIDINNVWTVRHDGKRHKIKSPHAQVYKYKSNMFNLHIPLLGLKEAVTKNFYNVIRVFVYFNTRQSDVDKLYEKPLQELKDSIDKLNSQMKDKKISQGNYDNTCNDIKAKKQKLERDQLISISCESLTKLVTKIKKISADNRFTTEIYNDFKRRLTPPRFIREQGEKILFDKKQEELTKSAIGFSKIKGIVGSGKTSIIAMRTINAFKRHGENILILTFNITLRTLIRDKISAFNYHYNGGLNANKIEIINYHEFFFSQLNELNIPMPNVPDNENEAQQFLNDFVKNGDIFKGKKTVRHSSIFIDEVQDYEPEWIKIIREYFLDEDGEMVLFGDQAQNIYNKSSLNKTLVTGFGEWTTLKKSYRVPQKNAIPSIVQIFKIFQEKFLIKKYPELELFNTIAPKEDQHYIISTLFNYELYIDELSLASTIDRYIMANDLVPNDVAIISSKIETLQKINNFFESKEKTITMFVTNKEEQKIENNHKKYEECKKVKKCLNKRKKVFFNLNSGVIKLSTIHSYKGMESETVFCVLHEDDTPEVVYTAITRAIENLFIFDIKNSQYRQFFTKMSDRFVSISLIK